MADGFPLMHVVGLVLHPERDCGGAVRIQVLGIDTEIGRLDCAAEAVTAQEFRERADLVVSLGGDGTMLRAMRLADRLTSPVLGVNLGKLGFLAEVDVPDLAGALSAIDAHEFTTEPRLAVDALIADQVITAFNDIAFVRFPGQKTASVAVHAAGERFVSYAADAVVVATPTGSTAYSFSAGGPIVSPGVEALLVTPVAPHSAYNRGLVISVRAAVAARRRARRPARPHHVLPAGQAQAPAHRLRGDPGLAGPGPWTRAQRQRDSGGARYARWSALARS
ncbi:MAG: NAD(+)/NADH kinase [Streptosporangiaceae bacterium]